MREKLIELFEECDNRCHTTSCDECEYFGWHRECNRMMEIDHLIANGVTIQKWIPVSERLPDETKDEYVLVVCDYYGKVKVETRKMWHIDACVTHWMPLPSTEGLK